MPFDLNNWTPDGERIAWLKRMRQRDGVAKPLPDLPLDLFHVDTWDELVKRITYAAWHIPDHRTYYAVSTALDLFYDTEVKSVIARRTKLAEEWGMSVRTLERMEEQGLELVDYFMTIYQLDPWGHGRLLAEGLMTPSLELRFVMEKAGIPVPERLWNRLDDVLKGIQACAV